jgi:hypothetical protein
VDVFGRRLVKVDKPQEPLTVAKLQEVAATLPEIPDVVTLTVHPIESPTLSDLLGVGLQEAPIPVEVSVKGKPGRKAKG